MFPAPIRKLSSEGRGSQDNAQKVKNEKSAFKCFFRQGVAITGCSDPVGKFDKLDLMHIISHYDALKEDRMNLKEYFENTEGFGVLATADGDGKVDAAVYARPHFMEDGTIAMIMRDRLTHHNLQSNPHAIFLFREDKPGYRGKRLFLTKVREEQDSELLQSLRRRQYIDAKDETKFLVFFKLDKELPLVGAGK